MLVVAEHRDVAEQEFAQPAGRRLRRHRRDQFVIDLVDLAVLEVALGIADIGWPQLLAHKVAGAGENSGGHAGAATAGTKDQAVTLTHRAMLVERKRCPAGEQLLGEAGMAGWCGRNFE